MNGHNDPMENRSPVVEGVYGPGDRDTAKDFTCTLDAEIAESMRDPEYAAAWRRVEVREATYGLDKRQARRVRRRMGNPPGPGSPS